MGPSLAAGPLLILKYYPNKEICRGPDKSFHSSEADQKIQDLGMIINC